MSLSNPTSERPQNPSTLFLEWKGGEGVLRYFDKSRGEKGENVIMPLPFTFIPLDILMCASGFSESENSGIYSNEIRNSDAKKYPITVKTFKGTVIAEGIYGEIKDKIVAAGGGYAQSVYIAYKGENGELKLGNIKFAGASFAGGKHKENGKDIELGAWMAFTGANKNILGSAITIDKEDRQCYKGGTKYFIPKFSIRNSSEETIEKAKEVDRELQEYLTQYFSFNEKPQIQQQIPAPSGVPDNIPPQQQWGKPFQAPERHANGLTAGTSTPIIDMNDPSSSLPF